MTATGWETLEVATAGPSGGLLAPGRILRALALGAGVRAEEIGALMPLGRDSVAVDVAVTRARMLETPRMLALDEASRPAVFVLRRPDDPPAALPDEAVDVLARFDGDAPAPGALAAALSQAVGPTLGADELGVGFVGPGYVRFQVPPRLAARGLPESVDVAGRKVTLELAGGKKNS